MESEDLDLLKEVGAVSSVDSNSAGVLVSALARDN